MRLSGRVPVAGAHGRVRGSQRRLRAHRMKCPDLSRFMSTRVSTFGGRGDDRMHLQPHLFMAHIRPSDWLWVQLDGGITYLCGEA